MVRKDLKKNSRSFSVATLKVWVQEKCLCGTSENSVDTHLALFSPGFRFSSCKSSWLSSLSDPEEEFSKLSFPESQTVIRTRAGTLFTKTPTWAWT